MSWNAWLLGLVLTGCQPVAPLATFDAGPLDPPLDVGRLVDAGPVDAGPLVDAGPVDAGVSQDAGVDAGTAPAPDAGLSEGHSPSSCGAFSPDLEPVDCTAGGDADAFCVFSDHCLCSEGFHCEDAAPEARECERGVGCTPL